MKRPVKPKIREPKLPRKPRKPSMWQTYATAHHYYNSKVRFTAKLPISFEEGDLKVKVTRDRTQVLIKDPDYPVKYEVYKVKMADYNKSVEGLSAEIEAYETAMAKYELDLARYEADAAEKRLLKAKKKVYG